MNYETERSLCLFLDDVKENVTQTKKAPLLIYFSGSSYFLTVNSAFALSFILFFL